MADIFCHEDFRGLLNGKRIIFLGDSNMRAIYKDWVWLTQKNTMLPLNDMKAKLEPSFAGDTLLVRSALHNGRDFKEVRVYQDESIYLHFMFVTKCLTEGLKDMFAEFKYGINPKPDVIIINSCLWDLTRWGPDGVKLYQKNLVTLMDIMRDSLPSKTLVLFTTALPVSLDIHGAFLVPDVDFLKTVIPYDIVEANNFMRDLAVAFEFDVLDLHFHLRFQIHRRRGDGVHWEPIVVRHLTNLLLTHISVSLGVELPGHARPLALARIHAVESSNISGRFQNRDSKNNAPVMENVKPYLSRDLVMFSQGFEQTQLQTPNANKRRKSQPQDSQYKWGFHDNPPTNNHRKERNSLFVNSRKGKRGVWEENHNEYSNASNYREPLYPTNEEKAVALLDTGSKSKRRNSRGRRLETDFRTDQRQNELDDYHFTQPRNRVVVWEHQRNDYAHVGGMHVSNYVEPMYPINQEKAEVLLGPDGHNRDNRYYSRRNRQKRSNTRGSRYDW